MGKIHRTLARHVLCRIGVHRSQTAITGPVVYGMLCNLCGNQWVLWVKPTDFSEIVAMADYHANRPSSAREESV